jgi:hypothetical protein
MPDRKGSAAQPPSECGDVYGILEQVRLRPGMWVRGGSLEELSTMLFGYSLALQVHGVPERFELHPALGPFADWLRETRGWSMVLGWATAIEKNAGEGTPLELFFGLLDEYRASRGHPATQAEGLSRPGCFCFGCCSPRLGRRAL